MDLYSPSETYITHVKKSQTSFSALKFFNLVLNKTLLTKKTVLRIVANVGLQNNYNLFCYHKSLQCNFDKLPKVWQRVKALQPKKLLLDFYLNCLFREDLGKSLYIAELQFLQLQILIHIMYNAYNDMTVAYTTL